jgi:copper chaperone CopZ
MMKHFHDARGLLPVLMLLALPACERAQGSGDTAATSASDAVGDTIQWARVEFTVQGMDCAGCVVATRTALRKLDGVRDAGGDFGTLEASSAWAVYDPSRVTPERMMVKIRELGYTPEVAREGPR